MTDGPPKFTPPLILHVRPPRDIAQRPLRVLIYGYPITEELINLRYGIIKASHPNITRNIYFQSSPITFLEERDPETPS